jgi:hypothetical protein
MAQQGDWRTRMMDLVNAVSDLGVPEHPAAGGRGTAGHQTVFRRYVDELEGASRTAHAWWQGLIDVEEERADGRDEALQNVLERHPGGAVSHKFVIAAVRRGWLACDVLNRTLPEADRVRPEDLALTWLGQRGHADLAEFLSRLAYWPIGLDDQSNWV